MKIKLLILLLMPFFISVTGYTSPFSTQTQPERSVLQEQAREHRLAYTESGDILQALIKIHNNLTKGLQGLASVFVTKTDTYTTDIVLSCSLVINSGSTFICSGDGIAIKLAFSDKEVTGLFAGNIGSGEFTQPLVIDRVSQSEVYSISSGGIKYRIIIVR